LIGSGSTYATVTRPLLNMQRGGRRQTNRGVGVCLFSDGHGGKEAAKYARDNLWITIKASDGFESGDPVKVVQCSATSRSSTQEQEAMGVKVRG